MELIAASDPEVELSRLSSPRPHPNLEAVNLKPTIADRAELAPNSLIYCYVFHSIWRYAELLCCSFLMS
jgi:hypothetical protein